MAEKHACVWCGRTGEEARKLLPGPVMYICNYCIENMSGVLKGEESSLSAQVREEVDQQVQESFKRMIKNLNLGPLQEKYQRLMRVKFKEEPGSPTFQQVFQEFKKGVEAEVPPDDFQTRYDLAIAYHEMGLVEDAFREMLASLRGALRQKDYDRASEVIAGLLHFHDDSARVIKGIHRVISEIGVE